MADEIPHTLNQADLFHMMVGRCITEWALIDDQLFHIFHQCVGPMTQCAVIYYKTPGLDLRIGMVDEIVKSVLPAPSRKSGGHPHPLVKRWNEIAKDIRDHLGTRRRIAHHPVNVRTTVSGALGSAPLNTVPVGAIGEVRESFEIYASEMERLRGRDTDQTPLTVTDLSAHFHAVNELWPKLYRFYLDLAGELYAKPSPPSPPQTPAT